VNASANQYTPPEGQPANLQLEQIAAGIRTPTDREAIDLAKELLVYRRWNDAPVGNRVSSLSPLSGSR